MNFDWLPERSRAGFRVGLLRSLYRPIRKSPLLVKSLELHGYSRHTCFGEIVVPAITRGVAILTLALNELSYVSGKARQDVNSIWISRTRISGFMTT